MIIGRKCGRVVCSACSPHRITIPRQFIVHPPQEAPNIIDLTSDDDDRQMSRFGPFGNPALGGGEEVRVCNPCVPDPNYDPPPQHGQTSPFPPFSPSPLSPHLPPSNALPRGSRSSHRSSQSVGDASRTSHHVQTQRAHDPFTDRRTSYYGATRVADLWPPMQVPPAYDSRSRPQSRSMVNSATRPPLDASAFPEHNNMTGSRRAFFTHRSQPPVPQHPTPAPPPRRQIPEEDECPVCGEELPPKGPDGDESERTQHVEDCIALHSGSTPPRPAATALQPTASEQTSTSLPSQRTRGMSSAAGGFGNGEGASNNRMSMSMRGLVPYVASEKDCVDEQGEEAECVICFEEFESGDRMARLVCWCKFHEVSLSSFLFSFGWWGEEGGRMESMDTELTTYRVAYASGGIRRGGVPVPRISCSTRYGEYRCAVSFPTSQCWYDVACQTQTLGKQDAPHTTPGISGLQGRFSTTHTHTHTYNKHILRLAQRRYVIEIPHSFLFFFLSFPHHTQLYSPFGLSLYPSMAYHIISSHLISRVPSHSLHLRLKRE